jgi:hypothetical protein
MVTTEEEIEGFHIVKAIVSEIVDPSRVVMRDQKSYCSVLLDDNWRKPICRMCFNSSRKKYVGTFDDKKNETRTPIQSLTEMYRLADQFKAAIRRYEASP